MFTRFFRSKKSNAKSQTPKSRQLRMEALEGRELLSVTPTEYAEIRELYSAFELSENMAEVNVIDLAAATTSKEVQAALDAAKATPRDDLIVLRTTAGASSVFFERTITVDFDESVSGKLTIVSYGDALAQVSSAENAVFSVESGDVRLGGFAFVGKENDATAARDLTPCADGATLTVERSIYLKQSGGDAFEGSNGQGQGPNDNATSGTDDGASGTGSAAFDDARFTADFQVDGSTWGYVAGLTLSEAVELTTATYYYQTDQFFDVDKTRDNVDDDELCWAATASNMLKYVGFDAGMTVDEIFQEFQYCFPDVAGWVDHGITWFLTGEFAPSSWENGVQIENPGGAHYPNVTVSDYLGSYKVDSRNANDAAGAMRVGTNALRFGGAVGLSIGWYAPSDAAYSQRNGGHAATLWGYYYDATKSENDPEYYTDLIISCSDDYTGDDRRYATPLDFDAAQNLYVMKDYNADGVENSSYGLLETIFVLAPDDSGDLLIPDLTARWKPEGWGDVLTLSSTRGNTSDNATNFEVGDSVYFSAAVSNVGAGASDAFEIKFELTNAAGETVDEADYWTFNDGLGANRYSWYYGNSNWAYSGLVAGEYTLTMTIDHRGAVAEINETNNVYAKTFTVSGETPSLVVTTNADATNANDSEISLREAIAYANAYPELGGTITFDPSLKGQTIALNGTEIALSKSVTIDASALYDAKNDAPGLTLDAGGLSRVFYITGGTAENPVELIGLKIANGSAPHGGGVMVYANSALSASDCVFVDNKTTNTGGGGLCVDGWADLENCVFSGNSAATDGGGFYVAANASLTATEVTISGNSAKYGGGLIVVGTATLSDSTISDNVATNRGGGARINPTGTATFIDSTISSNSANYGGGISSSGTLTTIETTFIENSATSSGGGVYTDGTTTLTDTTASGNTATYGGGVYVSGTLTATGTTVGNNEASHGGGVYVNDAATATFTDCVIGGNAASASGGAAYIDNDALATFTNCEIIDNTASYGGAAYVDASQAKFAYCTISDNSATNNGGGIYNGGTLTVLGTTISGNSATWGGGLQTWGTMRLANSAIVGNSATSGGGGMYLAGTTTITNATIAGNNAGWGGGFQIHPDVSATLYNSIVELNTASSNAQIAKNGTLTAYNTLSSYTDWDSGSSNYTYNSANPLFADAANDDYRLAENSQALDKGNDAYAVDADGNALQTDLAGKARFVGTVDLGAYELQPLATVLATPTLSVRKTTASSVELAIGSVENATSYTLEYSTDANFAPETTTTLNFATAGTKTLVDLSADVTYYVRVRANGDGGAYVDSAWTTPILATTFQSKPNLTSCSPGPWGWNVALAFSTSLEWDYETRFDEKFSVGDVIYFMPAIVNVGSAKAETFEAVFELKNESGNVLKTYSTTYSDGLTASTWEWRWTSIWNFRDLAAGVYTLTATIDAENAVDETDETDNVYVGTFTVVDQTKEAPSTVVTTNADVVDAFDGEISLREAIAYAQKNESLGSTITFDASLKGETIKLDGAAFRVAKDGITIDASALYDAENDVPGLTIDAGGETRAFYLNGGTEANPITLNGLTITGGLTAYGAGVFV
ncbi:MAG: hypothetical protein IJO40_03995 [Thermoguttaceae bacterium]|nr:hypothetical protein [Thermoguttaceae bacterium]